MSASRLLILSDHYSYIYIYICHGSHAHMCRWATLSMSAYVLLAELHRIVFVASLFQYQELTSCSTDDSLYEE